MAKSLILLFTLVAAEAFAVPPDSVSQIRELMTSLYNEGEFNGSILVATEGKIVYSGGFGMANFQTGEKFDTNTTSCVASVTKQFTAVAIMMLAEQQKLSYDDAVTKYIALPYSYTPVTIRHLLTHTSGVLDYSDLGSGAPDKLILKTKSLHFPPGQRYEYSNSNYVLLSLVIESITRKSFSDFLKENIFDPLGRRRHLQTYQETKRQALQSATINLEQSITFTHQKCSVMVVFTQLLRIY